MRAFFNSISIVICVLTFSAFAWAAGPLVIVGGGQRPQAAVSSFTSWAGGQNAKILIVPWGNGDPQSVAILKQEIERFSPQKLVIAPQSPFTPRDKQIALALINEATGIFFTGGDQNRIMSSLDASLFQALRDQHSRGVVIGGTSAGAAIMAPVMLTGETDPNEIDGTKVSKARGLGFLPDHIWVDQHFLQRRRLSRLMGLVMDDPSGFGIGIDEDTAVLIDSRGNARVVGNRQVVLMKNAGSPATLVLQRQKSGGRFQVRVR